MKKVKETDFMSEIEAIRDSVPARISYILLFSIAFLIVSLVVWASYSKVDILIRGSGNVVPIQDNQIVQSLEGGILEELLVNEGDFVTKGQVILRVNNINFVSEEKGTEAKFAFLKLKKNRLIAEANNTDFKRDDEILKSYAQMAKNEIDLYVSRKDELSKTISILSNKIVSIKADKNEVIARISKVKNSLYLLRKELKITKDLVVKKAVSKLEQMRLEREVSDHVGTVKTLKEQLIGVEADELVAIGEKDYQITSFRTRALGEITEVEASIESLKESLKSLGDRVDRAEIKSPVDGIVNKIAIKTIGGIIEPAMKLMEIVPSGGDLKIIAKISPNDIAFIKKNMDVKVKISAYDPQRYGSLSGKLVRIAANTTSDGDGNVFFEIEVRADKNYLGTEDQKLPIGTGMLAEIEIITGKRTIMEYLSKPFLRMKDRALTEM